MEKGSLPYDLKYVFCGIQPLVGLRNPVSGMVQAMNMIRLPSFGKPEHG
jgi:hypothetical protein